MNTKLYVGNCSFDLDESALRAFVESNGIQVSAVQMISDRETGRSRGFGFVELSGSENVQNAIDALNGKELNGRALTVNEARERKSSFDSSGSGYSGDRGKFKGNGKRPARW